MAKKTNLSSRNYNLDENFNSENFIEFEKGMQVEIPLSMIEIGDNIRDTYTDEDIDELGATIQEYGQIQPCKVYRKGNKYILKVGSRRFKACSQIGKETLLCIVEDEFADEKERIISQAIENEHRKNMTPYERELYISQLSKMGYTIKEISKMLHKSKGDVSEALKAHETREKNADIINRIPNADTISTRTIYKLRDLSTKEIENAANEALKKEGDVKENFRLNIEKEKEPKSVQNKNIEISEDDDDFSFDINIESNSQEKKESENIEFDSLSENITTEEENKEETNFSLLYHFVLNEKNKTFKFTIEKNNYDSDIEKFILRQIENYYIEKGYNIM